MSNGKRQRLRVVALFVAISIGLFVLLEGTARVYLFGLAGLVPARIDSVLGVNQSGFTRRSDDPRIGFEWKPNLDGYFKLVPFRTNSRGLRDREYPLEKPANTFRVAVLGSSFALPAGVAIEEAFHSRLEEQWTAEFAPRRCEFINFAVGMHGPEQLLAMLELRALAYDPDLILVAATRLSMPLFLQPPQPASADGGGAPLSFRRTHPMLQSFLVRLIRQRIGNPPLPGRSVGWLERLYVAVREPDPEPPAIAVAPDAPARRVRSSPLQRLGGIGERTGIPIALVWLEFESGRAAGEFDIEAAARAAGIHYLDTRDAFRGSRPSDYWIHELDPHPNASAHAIFAREIDAFLRAEGLIPR